MSRSYTKREIAYLLGCSVSTVEKNVDYLNIKPSKGDRGMNLYSQGDFQLLSQLNEHVKTKANSRDSFVPTAIVEVLEDEPRVSKLLAPQDDKSERFQHSLAIASEQDPLFDLELLQRVSNNRWLLPSKRLAPLFGISAKQLNSRKEYCYCGFIATREAYLFGKILWKITTNNQ
jgi:DNA-binding transcriptional MocR family regulator